jgi:hypothetical protein
MESLTAEIVSGIVQYIAGDTSIKLNNYACVSREWQAAVERLTVSSLKIKTTDFETLSTIFAPGICQFALKFSIPLLLRFLGLSSLVNERRRGK